MWPRDHCNANMNYWIGWVCFGTNETQAAQTRERKKTPLFRQQLNEANEIGATHSQQSNRVNTIYAIGAFVPSETKIPFLFLRIRFHSNRSTVWFYLSFFAFFCSTEYSRTLSATLRRVCLRVVTVDSVRMRDIVSRDHRRNMCVWRFIQSKYK